MKVLFLTLVNIKSFEEEHNIYADLCRELMRQGHTVQIVCPVDSDAIATVYEAYDDNNGILKVKTGKIQKTNVIRKGIATLMIGTQFKRAIKQHLATYSFDMVMYSTPPITLETIINYIKKRDHAVSYLLLKDIFPQNAVDLGMMTKSGLKSVIYRSFRRKEKKLYVLSDFIGCMSPANVKYLLAHNPEIDPSIVHVCPNSFDSTLSRISPEERLAIREQYHVPTDKKLFIYGGNLGEPQGCPFIIDCLKSVANDPDSFFVICGNGTGYGMLNEYARTSGQENLMLIPGLPREEYERFVGCCDVGLIFLDYRFTIPNFPSRLLSYMQKCMPVLACTDRATDVGTIITDGAFGWWCPSNDADAFSAIVREAEQANLAALGENSGKYLREHYSTEQSVRIITEKYQTFH